MRKPWALIFLAITVVTAVDTAQAASRNQKIKPIRRITLAEIVVPPFAYSRFCNRYPRECKVQDGDAHVDVELPIQRLRELQILNNAINKRIKPLNFIRPDFYNSWSILPLAGDCNDFAVTKRHALLAQGWASKSLLLAEVITMIGEHHLVLVVRDLDRDLVLDNLVNKVVPWNQTTYRWYRLQTPANPTYWASVDNGNPRAVSLDSRSIERKISMVTKSGVCRHDGGCPLPL